MECSRPALVSRVTQLKGLQWRGGVGIGWTGASLLPRLSPLLAREPSKSRVPETIPTLTAKLPPAGSSSDQSHLINLLVFGRSGASLVGPPSWWQYVPGHKTTGPGP